MTRFKFLSAASAALLLAACSGGSPSELQPGTLVTVGPHCLTKAEVDSHMPAGLSAADSTAMARAYIQSWIDARLVTEVASDEVDMAKIDRLTEEYRVELIKAQYRRTMAMQASDGIFSDDSLKAFYQARQNEFILERPMLRGIYLKIRDDVPNLSILRRLYKSTRPEDMDRLEKESHTAVHYDYFRERWVSIDQIETKIPIDFTPQVTSSLQGGKPLDVHSGGFVYLLSVSEYLPVGSVMPFEAAEPLVRERLLTTRRMAYAARLRNELFNTALDREIVKFPSGFNPLK